MDSLPPDLHHLNDVAQCRTARMTQHAAPIHHTRPQSCYSHANVPAVSLPTGLSARAEHQHPPRRRRLPPPRPTRHHRSRRQPTHPMLAMPTNTQPLRTQRQRTQRQRHTLHMGRRPPRRTLARQRTTPRMLVLQPPTRSRTRQPTPSNRLHLAMTQPLLTHRFPFDVTLVTCRLSTHDHADFFINIRHAPDPGFRISLP